MLNLVHPDDFSFIFCLERTDPMYSPAYTRAIVITPENYFIAMACLPDGFLSIPPEHMFGNVLIVHNVISQDPSTGSISTANGYMLRSVFDRYYVTEKPLSTKKWRKVSRAES